MYHAHLNYAQIGGLRIAMNNLPQGKKVKVMIGAIRAISHKETSLKNPVVSLAGREIAFPVKLASGHMLEFTPPRTYTVYDKKGDIITSDELEHDAPSLKSGANEIVFTCEPSTDAKVHARVTITTAGEALRE